MKSRKRYPMVIANVLIAYLELPDGLKESVRDMLGIAQDKEATLEDRAAATNTIHGLLFPTYDRDGILGIDLETMDVCDF